MDKFKTLSQKLISLIETWEIKLNDLNEETILQNRNNQHRNIKQIIGHMVDSASNNIHRVVHLQYQESPVNFPDYANFGNNDKWIAIQNYEKENWIHLIQLWKSCNLHFVHVILNVDITKFQQVWVSALGDKITLEEMITDYPKHFNLHLQEITELIEK